MFIDFFIFKKMIMAADIIDEAGIDIDPDSLILYLVDIIEKFSSSRFLCSKDFFNSFNS